MSAKFRHLIHLWIALAAFASGLGFAHHHSDGEQCPDCALNGIARYPSESRVGATSGLSVSGRPPLPEVAPRASRVIVALVAVPSIAIIEGPKAFAGASHSPLSERIRTRIARGPPALL